MGMSYHFTADYIKDNKQPYVLISDNGWLDMRDAILLIDFFKEVVIDKGLTIYNESDEAICEDSEYRYDYYKNEKPSYIKKDYLKDEKGDMYYRVKKVIYENSDINASNNLDSSKYLYQEKLNIYIKVPNKVSFEELNTIQPFFQRTLIYGYDIELINEETFKDIKAKKGCKEFIPNKTVFKVYKGKEGNELLVYILEPNRGFFWDLKEYTK